MIRILLLADTHLAFGLRTHAKETHHPRAPDFEANYRRAIAVGVREKVDVIVHGGDVFHRSRVPRVWVERAMAPLFEAADAGISVVVVPGNHEKSRIPWPLLTAHPGVHILQRARTVAFDIAGLRVAIGGFPFVRHIQGALFQSRLAATGLTGTPADIRFLCIHQTVEGAVVGPTHFVFRRGQDVVPTAVLPPSVTAVLSGHIHRRQIIDHDLCGRPLACPVIYPGSTERTSFAEIDEPKGCMILEVNPETRRVRTRFVSLPARPMVQASIDGQSLSAKSLGRWIERAVDALPERGLARIGVHGPLNAHQLAIIGHMRDQIAVRRPDTLVRIRPTG